MFHPWLSRGVFVCSLLSLFAEPLWAQNRIIQQNSSSATATGTNNFAASQVQQSATQNRANSQQQLTIKQYGSANATADGENNVVITDIYQESHQQGSRYGNGDLHNIQRATINGRAAGRNNRVFSNTRQYNWQN